MAYRSHYHAIAEDVTEQTRVGIVLYPQGYTPKYIIQNKLVSAGSLDIPPGESDVRHDAYFTLKKPAKLLLFQPHMHYRGRAMALEAIYPDRRVELLSYVPRFDVMWQVTYAYKNPPVFPAGTMLHQTSWHDNSRNNKRNPDPTNWVGNIVRSPTASSRPLSCRPEDVAFGANGEIFVADGHQGSRVVKFSHDGRFIKSWGTKGDGPGQFNTPHAIATDSRGRLFVADRGNRRIQIFDQEGNFLDEWKQFGRPSGILITADDTLYVADVQDKQGITYGSAKDGVVRGSISGTPPESMALGADGSLYAGETTTGRVLRKFVKH